jgi:hypothetical protein
LFASPHAAGARVASPCPSPSWGQFLPLLPVLLARRSL